MMTIVDYGAVLERRRKSTMALKELNALTIIVCIQICKMNACAPINLRGNLGPNKITKSCWHM